MATVMCAISGLRFECSYCSGLRLPTNEGFPHPIFAAPSSYLETLYTSHSKGHLPLADSYLLLLAYLHSSGKIQWEHPVTLDPQSDTCKALIENNLSQLVSVLHKTNCIRHPKFTQPNFKVTFSNSNLENIAAWIRAWNDNITAFYAGAANEKEVEALQRVENRLSALILGGESPERYARVIADWAAKAACFPPSVSASYKEVIASCFSSAKMFATPLATIKEVKEYCESNIEVGSIHFHTLHKVLSEGIRRHVDYLGGAATSIGYTLLPTLDISSELATPQQLEELEERKAKIIATEEKLAAIPLPDRVPQRADFKSEAAFTLAKLRYRVAANRAEAAQKDKDKELTHDI